jgi:hypothetical protein
MTKSCMNKGGKVHPMKSGGVVKKAAGGKIDMPTGPMSDKDMKMMGGAKKFNKGGMSRGR